MSAMIGNPLLLGGGDYEISRSVRLRSSASAYFNRTPGSSGTRTKATISVWSKRGSLGARNPIAVLRQGATDYFILEFQSDDTLQVISVTSSSVNTQLVTTQVFRDPSAWYHIVFTYDSTVASPGSSSIYLSVNGVKVTALSTATYPSQNTNLYFNVGSVDHTIGRLGNLTTYADCYLTEINSIDGQALTPSSFGETDAVTGVWKPKRYAGTYGTNGFYLNFSDNSNNTASTIGKDYSGNGNNWTPNNISVTSGATYDSMLDVPTPWADGGNGRGNYAVLNPLNPSSGTVSDGNLRQLHSAASYQTAISSMAMPSGKWYCEITCTAIGGTGDGVIGVSRSPVGATFTGNTADSYGWYSKGSKYNNGSSSAYASGAQWTTGDVIGIAFDNTAGSFEFYKNGTALGVAFSGLTLGDYYFAVSSYSSTTFAANFGQRPFAYTPPSGFKALHTGNLPEPTIKKGNLFFDINLWTGNGSSQTITNAAGFAPDLVWVKERSSTSGNVLVDSVRGAGIYLESNATAAEGTDATTVSALNSNGFSVGSSGATNQSSQTYVGWQWKEGATPGFDIVTYSGNSTNRTIAHSLGVAPSLIIFKNRSVASNWPVYSTQYAANQYLALNTTGAVGTASDLFNSTAATSSVFSVGTSFWTNASSYDYVAYLFSEVAGFSRFGSYTGNGSSDGPFVFCGFRPRFIMLKMTNTSGYDWVVYDTARATYNVVITNLAPNNTNTEAMMTNGYDIDILSNGFKLRVAGGTSNVNSASYIFAAFAENPFKYALAR